MGFIQGSGGGAEPDNVTLELSTGGKLQIKGGGVDVNTLQDGALPATTAGRAKMADGFVTAAKTDGLTAQKLTRQTYATNVRQSAGDWTSTHQFTFTPTGTSSKVTGMYFKADFSMGGQVPPCLMLKIVGTNLGTKYLYLDTSKTIPTNQVPFWTATAPAIPAGGATQYLFKVTTPNDEATYTNAQSCFIPFPFVWNDTSVTIDVMMKDDAGGGWNNIKNQELYLVWGDNVGA